MTTDFKSTDEFIKLHIRTGQHWNKKVITMSDAKWQTLARDTYIDGITFAAGSKFKVFETSNFGWIVFGPESLTPSGNTPSRRIFKY
jgi:hypothetical protein